MCRKLFSHNPHVVSPLDLMRPGTLQASSIKLCCKETSTLEQGLVILNLEISFCYVKHSAAACMHFRHTLCFYRISMMYHCVPHHFIAFVFPKAVVEAIRSVLMSLGHC